MFENGTDTWSVSLLGKIKKNPVACVSCGWDVSK